MTFLKIIVALLGLTFTMFGYFIFYGKKYHLINGFDADFKAGRKTEADAKCVGMTELLIGVALLTIAIVLIRFV